MLLGATARAQFIPESTYDWTSTAGAPSNLAEAWADTKSPGKGFTYSVGTIEVEQTDNNPTFSTYFSTGGPATVSNPLSSLDVPFNVVRKQVAILQCINSAGEIQWQRYFFGQTTAPGARRATNARAISVWEADVAANARIAICGETYEDTIPLSQAPFGFVQNPALPNPDPTGFIAVYDGNGALLWTHHFFGVPLANPLPTQNQPDCAITDVSIRVEGEGANQRDVVTYCGISSYGNPDDDHDWLDTIEAFTNVGVGLADGNADFGPYQWDGIVGRISRDHAAPHAGLQREFHAIVGGPEQDGLFGIAEMGDDRFIAVGSSKQLTAPTGSAFPFVETVPVSVPLALGIAYPYAVGVAMTFDAAPTRLPTPGKLELENGIPLGTFSGAESHASDVLVQLQGGLSIPYGGVANSVFIVGTTADPAFVTKMATSPTPGHDTLQGNTDGFVLGAVDFPPTRLLNAGNLGCAYVGGPQDDGLTGVASWNEHADHVQVCGYSLIEGNFQMQAASFICPGIATQLRRTTFGGPGTERPAFMGATNATNGASGISYQLGFAVQDPAGGGIAADERARITIVGASDSATGYPVEPVGIARSFLGGVDAVRTELDMLPTGVARTDGTGTDATGAPIAYPPAGYSGGTTPECLVALTPFGQRVGGPTPQLRRMLLDFEGDNAPNAQPQLWTTRPAPNSDIVLSALQIGLPLATPVLLELADIWMWNTQQMTVFTEIWQLDPYVPSRLPFTVNLPASPAAFTLQVVCLLLNPITSSSCVDSTGTPVQMTTFASPALFFEY